MKTVIVYYSYSSNTLKLVNKVKEKLNCDVIELKPVIPYSDNYQEVVDQALDEVNKDYMPEIEEIKIDLRNYDKIILGTPVWWYTFASPINTFLNDYDLDNKTIIPLVTNAGWLGHTIKDIKKKCKDSIIEDEISIKFDKEKLLEEDKFNKWLEELNRRYLNDNI